MNVHHFRACKTVPSSTAGFPGFSFGHRDRDRKTDESDLFKNAEALNTRDWESSLSNTSILKFSVRASQRSHFCNVEDLDFLAARAYMFTYQGLFKSPSNTTACSFSYSCKNSYKQIHTTTQSITTPKRSYQIQKEKQSSNELLEQISFISLGNLPYIAEYHRQ